MLIFRNAYQTIRQAVTKTKGRNKMILSRVSELIIQNYILFIIQLRVHDNHSRNIVLFSRLI